MDTIEFLQRLTEIPAVAGREHRMREFILQQTKGLFDETRVDALGSLICVRRPRPGKSSKKPKAGDKPLKVMIAAHMDQIGFMVRHVDDKGFVRVNAVGGFDPRNLFARFVTVCTESAGDLPGVMNPGGKPVHIASEEDKRKVPEIKDLVVDMGLPGDQVLAKVKVGDMVVIQTHFQRVGNTVVSQAMDNRVACWWAIESIRALKEHECEIHAVFTVQEEIGCKGAGAAAWDIRPDVAISLDVTLCVDTPGVPDDERVTKQGLGVGLLAMDSSMISDIELLRQVEAIGQKRKIKTQRTILPRGGNDGYTIQVKAAGHRVLTMVCPTRNVHTVTEMVLVDDLFASRDLLAAYLSEA